MIKYVFFCIVCNLWILAVVMDVIVWEEAYVLSLNGVK
jgi:hypothetical protein